MEYVGKLGSLFTSVSSFYNDINPATLSGAVDIVVVEQEDGDLACSPFHVRFGKLSLLMPQEKKIEIKVNGQVVPYLMKVGEAGESFFVFETDHEVPEEFQTSPIVGAVNENKTDEEPPFLDIGESKSDDKEKQSPSSDNATKDPFEEEHDTHMKLPLPAELQSPKMIIEEQMDKVVTNMEPYATTTSAITDPLNQLTLDTTTATPQNDVYPMDDGSTLLERVIPDAITTTTIAKETFIVRPANGDIYSKILDVSHRSVQKRDDNGGQQLHKLTTDDATAMDTNTTTTTTATQPEQKEDAHGHNESIVLDMAGYKTGKRGWEDDDNMDLELSAALENVYLDRAAPDVPQEDTHLDKATDELENNNNTPASLWGWGNSRRNMTDDSDNQVDDHDDDDTASIDTDTTKATEISQTMEDTDIAMKYQLVPGTIYRIEMSLCGLSSFGSDEKENTSVFDEHQITYDTFMHNPNLLNDKRLVFRYERRYYAAAGNTGPFFTSLLLYKQPLQPTQDESPGSGAPVEDGRESYLFGKGWRQWLSRSSSAATTMVDGQPKKEKDEPGADSEKEATRFTTTTKTTTVGWNAEHQHHGGDLLEGTTGIRKHYAKTLRLTSDQLKQLGLNKGVNTISFSVTSAYQGTATCAAKIFYWDYDMPIVISDIDGTITKSDALGHVFTMIGKDWTHHGVAKLYTDICNNGYKILYLTSRAIGQADYTRDYLKKVAQGKYQLPDGPVIMSPDRLFTSFHREVIMRKPEVFKMACLKDIQRLFGDEGRRQPFYAGFGNRLTDAISYRSVLVPASRIFTIDPYGDLKLELLKGFTSSYLHLNDLVDHIFPPVISNSKNAIDNAYNDWHFWKQPLPNIDLPLLSPPTSPPTSPKPRPIKPDLSTLPMETVAESEKQHQHQYGRSGLLRSLTSMSTSSSSDLGSNGKLRQQSLPPPPPSPQSLSSSASSSSSVPTGRSRVHSFTATLRRPSLLLGSSIPPHTTSVSSSTTPVPSASTPAVVADKQQPSTTVDDEDETNNNKNEPVSPSLMYHISNGVRHTLSKTFAYGQGNTSPTDTTTRGDDNNDEEDDFDTTLLDDLENDMDAIPFI
ncbi:unnamed protein product [Absidia cylindrospora]